MSNAAALFEQASSMSSRRSPKTEAHQQKKKGCLCSCEGKGFEVLGEEPNQGQVKPLHEQVMSPTQGDSSSSRAPEMAMLRRRRSSRAGADDEEPHQEDLQLVGQELVPAFQQPVASGRDGLEVEVKGLEKTLSTPTRSTTGRPDTGTGPTELEVFRSGGSKISPKEALKGPKGKPRVLAPLALPSGQPPLFTEDQLRSARAQARQAPTLYGTLAPPVFSGDDPPGHVKRPDFMKEEEKRYEVKEERKGSGLFDEGHEEEGGSYEGHQKGHAPEVFDLEQQDHLREQEEEVMWRWQISQEVRMLTELCHQQKLENTLLQQELHERRLKEDQEEKGVRRRKKIMKLVGHLLRLGPLKNMFRNLPGQKPLRVTEEGRLGVTGL